MSRRRNTILTTSLSVLLTLTVFAYLFSNITIEQVTDLIRNIDTNLLMLFVLLSFSMQFVRTVRYRIILNAAGQRTGFFSLFLVVLVRGLCVDLLPARLGELVYIYLVRARLGVELGAATASFALAFLFDVIALTPLLLVAALTVGSRQILSVPAIIAIGITLLIISAALIAYLPAFIRAVYGIAGFLPAAWRHTRSRIRHFLASTHRQIVRTRTKGIYLQVFGCSILVRLLKYIALYTLLLAVLFPQDYTLHALPFPKVFLGFTAAEMAASLPVAGIAGFGAYEGAWALVFSLLGFGRELAQAAGVTHHLVSQIYGYMLGLTAFLILYVMRPRV